MKLSIALTNYNRYQSLVKSFEKVLGTSEVSEVVISDDASDEKIYNALQYYFAGNEKVKLYRNEKTLGVYFNKKGAIEKCSNQYCISLDSDNCIGTDYIKRICACKWEPDTIFCPVRALPDFLYDAYSDWVISRQTIASHIDKPMMECALNTANYFVNRDRYLQCFDSSVEPGTSDSIFMAYNWLKAGGKMRILKGLTYQHAVHSGSHYQNNNAKYRDFHKSLLQKIRELK